MSRKADYVYRNADDTQRARLFRREDDRWDWDLFKKHVLNGGWSIEEGWCGCSTTRTRKDALAWLDDLGIRIPIQVETVAEGWPEKLPPKPTKDAAVEIRAGQTWRQGSRRLVVDSVGLHWNQKMHPGERQIGCHFVDASGRETGTMIRGRQSARQQYHEQRFREKYRYVGEPNIERNRAGEPAYLTGCPECGTSGDCDCNEEP